MDDIDTTRIRTVVRNVRDILMPHYGNVESVHQKDGSPVNVVTDIDVAVESYLRDELHKLNSSIGFVGEETGGNRDAKEFWLVDPIDGTQHFIRGRPLCTTMLSLIQDGRVIFATIYDFVNDKLYHAELGKGAYCDNKKIRVSDRSLNEAYIAWETHLDKEENHRTFTNLCKKCVMTNTICAGSEFADVASGRLDGRLCFDPHGKDYDFAAGSLLVAEAGGVVANIGSRSYDYRDVNFIATNPSVFKELTEGADAIFPIK